MSTREALAALIERFALDEGPVETCCPRVNLYRVHAPTEPMHAVHDPSFCVLAQGRKRVLVGDAIHEYDDLNFFLSSIDVPVAGQVIEASPEKPYLAFRVVLDANLISEMIMECGLAARLDAAAPLVGGMSAGAMTPALFDAACRMVGLMDCPDDAPILGPLIEREMLYRLLTGPQGGRLAQIARRDGRLRQVNRAIGWIKRNFDQPFSIDAVADEARDERLGPAPALQGGDLAVAAAIPEADPPAGSSSPDPSPAPGRRHGRPQRRLRQPLAVQP
jgi:hypothetical protein